MIGYLYLTINDVNEIIYVGKRQKPKFEKWYKGSGKHLKLAFKKYGKEKFHTYVIEECDSVEKLCAAEKKWIAYYKSLGKELYNIASRGNRKHLALFEPKASLREWRIIGARTEVANATCLTPLPDGLPPIHDSLRRIPILFISKTCRFPPRPMPFLILSQAIRV